MRWLYCAAIAATLTACGATAKQRECEQEGNEWRTVNDSGFKWSTDPADGQYKYRYVIDIDHFCYVPQ